MKIHWPWKNPGCWGLTFKQGLYIDFFRRPYWGIFIFNPNRRAGAWSCRWCKDRVTCLVKERCRYQRTWIIISKLKVVVKC